MAEGQTLPAPQATPASVPPHREQVLPAHIAPGQDGDQRAPPRAPIKRNRSLNLHLVCPVTHKCLFFFFIFQECQKPPRDSRGGFLTASRSFAPVILRCGATLCPQKKPQSPKPAPSGITQKLLFVTVLCVTAWHYFPNPAFSSLPFFFFPGYQVHRRDSDQYKTALLV